MTDGLKISSHSPSAICHLPSAICHLSSAISSLEGTPNRATSLDPLRAVHLACLRDDGGRGRANPQAGCLARQGTGRDRFHRSRESPRPETRVPRHLVPPAKTMAGPALVVCHDLVNVIPGAFWPPEGVKTNLVPHSSVILPTRGGPFS